MDRPAQPSERGPRSIRIGDYRFDPLAGPIPVPESLRHSPAPPSGELHYLVQLRGRVSPEPRRRLEAAGARLLHYVPHDAFIVRADAEAMARVRALPDVRWADLFHPAYKLNPNLAVERDSEIQEEIERAVGAEAARASGLTPIDTRRLVRVLVASMESAAVPEIAQQMVRLGATGVAISLHGSGQVRAGIPRRGIERLARQPAVLWIEREPISYVHNFGTRWVIQSFDAQSEAAPIHEHGLLGTGQTITVADTGIRYNHDAFKNPDASFPGPGHRKVTAYYIPPGVDPSKADLNDNPSSNFYHGTHVSGSVAGDNGILGAYDTEFFAPTGVFPMDGQAVDARIQVQDLSNLAPGVFPPADLRDLYQAAVDANVPGRVSSIHNNSWGGRTGATSPAAQTDDFIWNHPDFVVVFSAGNSGPSLSSLTDQARAKNILAVGGTGRDADANDIMLCDFPPPFSDSYCSSRGIPGDRRLKPDVMAPGEIVFSASGASLGSYTSSTGTSMATPAVSGAAALVRQYFLDGWHPAGERRGADGSTPSAALVKAVLVNSAVEMTSPEAYSNLEERYPNLNQGWGRILLDGALYFGGDTRYLTVVDQRAGVASGESSTFPLIVNDPGEPLEITLVWTDAPNVASGPLALVNDLDLVVTAPSGTVYLGNRYHGRDAGQSEPNPTGSVCDEDPGKAGADCTNNVEGVLVLPPDVGPGRWIVEVRGYDVPVGGWQPFALVMTAGRPASERGVVQLDRAHYRSSGIAALSVADAGADLNPAAPDALSVQLTSDTETTPESVTLVETGPATGLFGGSLPLQLSSSASPSDGRLQVRAGDTVRAVYFDVNAGGGSGGSSADSALVDDTPPVITAVRVEGHRADRATILWSTDEPATSVVRYGTSVPPGLSATAEQRVLQHSLTASGLPNSSLHFYSVESTDEAGNTAVHDNSSAFHRFYTAFPPVADHRTRPGRIASGSYLDTRASDDVREVLQETKSGSSGHLGHVWRFQGIPAGLHRLIIEGFLATPIQDIFFVSFSTDGSGFTNITSASLSAFELESVAEFGSPSDTGTLYIRLNDSIGGDPTTLNAVHVDHVAIAVSDLPACPDDDGDGYTPVCAACTNAFCPLTDCNDAAAGANPGQSEGPAGSPSCADTLDNDCDGLLNQQDPDCAAAEVEDRLDPDGDLLRGWQTFPFTAGAFNKVDEGFPSNDGADYLFTPESLAVQEATDTYSLEAPSNMQAVGRTTTIAVDVRVRQDGIPKKNDHTIVGITLLVDGNEQGEAILEVTDDTTWRSLTFANGNWNNRNWSRSQVETMSLKVRGRTDPSGSPHVVQLELSTVQVRVRSR